MASPVLPARHYHYRRCPRIRKGRSSGDPSSATSDEDGLSDYGIDVDEDEGLDSKMRSSNKLTIPTPRMDTYRFSMANMEDSQDVELDAILGELCALETQFDREMMPKSQSVNHSLNQSNGWKCSNNSRVSAQNPHSRPSAPEPRFAGHCRSNSGGGGARPRFELGGLQVDMYGEEFLKGPKTSEFGPRTDSPDNDSAFSDNVSMLSSESSASSGGLPRGDASSRSISSQSSSMSLASSPTQAEQAARIKAEKIKIALEKMKEASIKKLFIKAFSADNSAKSLLIDERMTVGHVCRLLAEKNHVPMDTKWGLVEHIPELYMERVYEDHEFLVENLLLWTRDSCNQLLFLSREDKYDLFRNPQLYLLGGTSSEKDLVLDEEAKSTLIEEFFCSSGGTGVPEVEGQLYLKSDGKKAWKKHFFVLRASGLYYCPKGKSKLSKDLLCLTTFEMNNVYFGVGWRKKYKAPSDYCFAIKHPQIQTKSSKYIKYLCAEDEASLNQWVMGIRAAKFGYQLKENYDNLLRDIEEDDLDTLAHARSFSVSSVAKTPIVSSDSSDSSTSPKDANVSKLPNDADMYEQPTTVERLYKGKIIRRQDSIKSSKSNKSNASSSSGCLSERSSTGTPTADQMAFEADFPMGTIKRKPSMTPKIPLTTTTRNLAKQSCEDGGAFDNASVSTIGSNGSGGSLCGSLGRSTGGRFSLRRSKTDDRISFGSLTRKMTKQGSSDHVTPTLLREDLPLPPPPPEVSSPTECFNFDTLPPPPPEAFRSSTLSLDTLPPPPLPPSEPGKDERRQAPGNTSFLQAEPPTSPTSPADQRKEPKSSPAVPPKPRKAVQRRQSENDAAGRFTPRIVECEVESVVIKPKPSKHKLNLELPPAICNGDVFEDPEYSTPLCASPRIVRNRRTSAPCVAPGPLQVHSAFSPVSPQSSDRQSRSQRKPSPPKRSETTKLSSAFTAPQRRSASASAAPYDQSECPPPESFLRDLQKVMVRKWKVAQQLSLDGAAVPHPILGFRDPDELPKPPKQRGPRSPPLPSHNGKAPRSHSKSAHRAHKSAPGSKKHPPPPPPKRNAEALA